ncbi:TetR/AcrR family transcriptional regulator [Nocardia sp. CA-135398]|uniref:TetR/AcrR family transcriptional regulator n=1 Tax=Nocardia sp. CA-135398 TaxID=3239977 RepID=UPI003D9690A5
MARKKSLDEGPVLSGRILDSASHLFYERGYGSTSIRDIAEAVGISSSTMYHHFMNKQDILHAIVSRFMTDFVDATVPTLRDRSLSPTERIRRVVRLHIEFSQARRPELLIGNPIRYALDPANKEQGIKLQRAYHDAVQEVIEEGCRCGEFATDNVAVTTLAILDMLNGIREWFSPSGPLGLDELIDRYIEIVLSTLGARDRSVRT